MKKEPTNVIIGRLRGAIKNKNRERSLEILDVLSERINSFEPVIKELKINNL